MYAMAQTSMVEIGPNNPSMIGMMMGLTLAAALAVGPILGSVVSEFKSWRLIFMIK